MKVNLLVDCQYYENYNVGPDGFNTYGDGLPHWKPKGGYSFSMPIDSDYLIYADESEIVSAITKVVEKQNTISCKFEYREYKIQWTAPTKVGGLEDELKSLIDEEVAV
jgi:hypothetical protein